MFVPLRSRQGCLDACDVRPRSPRCVGGSQKLIGHALGAAIGVTLGGQLGGLFGAAVGLEVGEFLAHFIVETVNEVVEEFVDEAVEEVEVLVGEVEMGVGEVMGNGHHQTLPPEEVHHHTGWMDSLRTGIQKGKEEFSKDFNHVYIATATAVGANRHRATGGSTPPESTEEACYVYNVPCLVAL